MNTTVIISIVVGLLAIVVIGIAVFSILKNKKNNDEGSVSIIDEDHPKKSNDYPDYEQTDCPVCEQTDCPVCEHTDCPACEQADCPVCEQSICDTSITTSITSVGQGDLENILNEIQSLLNNGDIKGAVAKHHNEFIDDIYVSTWDVSNVTDFSDAFKGRDKFNEDISDWNVSNGTSFQGMFEGCRSFNQDLSKWFNGTASKATNFNNMFKDCESFTADLKWKPPATPISVSGMFEGCWKMLVSPTYSWWGFKFSNADRMHARCYRLEIYIVEPEQFSQCASAANMFDECKNLIHINMYGVKFPENCDAMFRNCKNLKSIQQQPTSRWGMPSSSKVDWSRLNSARFMFQACNNLEISGGESIKFESLTDGYSMFRDCYNIILTNLGDASGVLANLKNADGMFKHCVKFNPVNISKWNLAKLTSANEMFYNCKEFGPKGLDKINLNKDNIKDNLTSIFVGTKVGRKSDRTAEIGGSPLWTGLVAVMEPAKVYDMFAVRQRLNVTLIDADGNEIDYKPDPLKDQFTSWYLPKNTTSGDEDLVLFDGGYVENYDMTLLCLAFKQWNVKIPWCYGPSTPPAQQGSTRA